MGSIWPFWPLANSHICILVTYQINHVLKLSVGLTRQAYLLEIDGLLTQGWRPGRTVGGSVGGIYEMYCSDWSNGIQYQVFDTRPDTEFKSTYPQTRH